MSGSLSIVIKFVGDGGQKISGSTEEQWMMERCYVSMNGVNADTKMTLVHHFLSKETAERRFWLNGDLGADGNDVPVGAYSRGNHKVLIRFEQEMIGWEEVFMIELMGPLMLPGRIS